MAGAVEIPSSSRVAVRERDGGSCRGCGAAGQGRELHHIVYRSQERNNHDPSNLISLCYRCHRMVHSYPDVCREACLSVVAGEALTVAAAVRWKHGRGKLVEMSRGTL